MIHWSLLNNFPIIMWEFWKQYESQNYDETDFLPNNRIISVKIKKKLKMMNKYMWHCYRQYIQSLVFILWMYCYSFFMHLLFYGCIVIIRIWSHNCYGKMWFTLSKLVRILCDGKLFGKCQEWHFFYLFLQLHMVISLNVLNFLLSKQFASILSFFMFLFSFCSALGFLLNEFLRIFFVSCGFSVLFLPRSPYHSQHHASVEFMPLLVDLCGCGCFYTSFIAHILSVQECNLYHLICSLSPFFSPLIWEDIVWMWVCVSVSAWNLSENTSSECCCVSWVSVARNRIMQEIVIKVANLVITLPAGEKRNETKWRKWHFASFTFSFRL